MRDLEDTVDRILALALVATVGAGCDGEMIGPEIERWSPRFTPRERELLDEIDPVATSRASWMEEAALVLAWAIELAPRLPSGDTDDHGQMIEPIMTTESRAALVARAVARSFDDVRIAAANAATALARYGGRSDGAWIGPCSYEGVRCQVRAFEWLLAPGSPWTDPFGDED